MRVATERRYIWVVFSDDFLLCILSAVLHARSGQVKEKIKGL